MKRSWWLRCCNRALVCFCCTLFVMPSFVTGFRSSVRNAAFLTLKRKSRFTFVSKDATTNLRSSYSSLHMARVPFEKGDAVQVAVNGTLLRGTVAEKRGAGWYAVQVPLNDGSSSITMKFRGNSIQLANDGGNASDNAVVVAAAAATDSSSTENSTNLLPLPKIINLDQLLKEESENVENSSNKQERQFLETCRHHATYQKWVLFSDLHVAPSSLNTCLQVLDAAHALAKERNAGVLFLGDFWHHRGTLRVDCLNAILNNFRDWKVPLILIPGNHDQVTLGTSHNHGLTPLLNSYRVECIQENGTLISYPGPLVFSHATKFMDAMFIPHIRDLGGMKHVLQSIECKSASALFCHADVAGASMNDLIISRDGVSPSTFPIKRDIYSGHFHKPHVVTKGGVSIRYVGSPYQTSLSEAQQQKSLLVVDAKKNWECVEEIPLDIGRRHFRINSLQQLLDLEANNNDTSKQDGLQHNVAVHVKHGDRVVVSMNKQTLDEMRRKAASQEQQSPFDSQVETLRKVGATVEVREIASLPIQPSDTVAHKNNFEEMTPEATIKSFLTSLVSRNAMANDTVKPLVVAALGILEELELTTMDETTSMSVSRNDTELSLESVTLQGFGPFADSVTYPLSNRGLVLLRGVNKDGGSDSNGSGKSSLAMAALWALTGSTDPRPFQDGKVADVVNDNCKSARVSIRGTLNGEPFAITRTKTANRGGLSFHLGGEDLTTQSAKDTQTIIDERLGVRAQVLARTIFHGQHSMNGLLEASDAKLKEELSLIVPLELWQNAASLARSKSRIASKEASELIGMIRLRKGDLQELQKRWETAKETVEAKRAAYIEAKSRVEEQVGALQMPPGNMDRNGCTLNHLRSALDETNSQVKDMESRLVSLREERDSEFPLHETHVNDLKWHAALAQDELQSKQRNVDRAELKLETEQTSLDALQTKWNFSVAEDGETVFVPPKICPTCQQPISSLGEGHSHADFVRVAEKEVKDAIRRVSEAESALKIVEVAREEAQGLLSVKQKEIENATTALEHLLSIWDSRLSLTEKELDKARELQSQHAVQFSDAAQHLQKAAEIKSLNTSLAAELDSLESADHISNELCSNVLEAEATLKELEEQRETKENLSAVMSTLADTFGPRGVQTFVLQNSIDALQSITQAYLDELSDGTQKLKLALDSGDRILRTAFVSSPDGSFSERPLSSLSGGQWRRCSLAMSLGFADIVARRGRMRPSLCVLDEPLTHLDRSGRANFGKLLRSLLRGKVDGVGALESSGMAVSTIVIILQDLAAEEIEESFDVIDEVVKRDGSSTISIDEKT